MPYLKNTANQTMRGALVKADGSRYTDVTGFTVSVGIDNAAAAPGAGTLALDGVNGFAYTFTQAETAADFGTLQIDHAEAAMPWTANVSWLDDVEAQVAGVTTQIDNLNDLSAAGVQAELETYDSPTRAEATSDKDEILAGITTGSGDVVGQVETAIDNKQADYTLPATDAIGWVYASNTNEGSPIAADELNSARTFYISQDGYRARNVITINVWVNGKITLACDFGHLLNPETAIFTANSVKVTNVDTLTEITTSDLRRQKNFRVVNADVGTITAAGEYMVEWQVTTSDSQTLTASGTLLVKDPVTSR